MIDVTDRGSVKGLVVRNLDDPFPVLMVANKIDSKRRLIATKNIVNLAKGIGYLAVTEISAKEGTNIQGIFDFLTYYYFPDIPEKKD